MSFLFCISIGFAQAVTVEGDLTADATWTSDNTYYLNNQLFVKDGVTLTIEAGTEILGRYDANYSADNAPMCCGRAGWNDYGRRYSRCSNHVPF